MAIRTDDAERIASAYEALAVLIADSYRNSIARAEAAEARANAAEAIVASQADNEARINAALDRLTASAQQLQASVNAQS